MKIQITDLQKEIARGPALVIGPGMSTSPGNEGAFLSLLQTRYRPLADDPPVATYLDYTDVLIAGNRAAETDIRKEAERFFVDPLISNPQLEIVAKANWTAILSLASDDHFRGKLADFFRSKPTKWDVTTVSSPGEVLSLTAIPYYALMGDIRDKRNASKLALTRAQYLKRTRAWAEMLGSLPDIVKSDPIIFLGTASIVDRVCDLMNELMRLSPRIPKRLIFLESDPTATNAVFRNLTADVCEIQTVNCQLRDIGSFLSADNLSIYKLPLFSDVTKRLVDYKTLASVEDQIAYVPRREELEVNSDERNRLLDSLFRPTNLDWAPYCLGMELKRDICATIQSSIEESFADSGANRGGGRVVHVTGEAGIGKTVALRSVAFDLAQHDYLCFWIKKSYGEISGGRFDAVTKALAKGLDRKKSRVIFFLDDPWGSRVRAAEVMDSLDDAPFEWILVVCNRKSDAALAIHDVSSTEIVLPREVEVPPDFSTGEFERLPAYLVSLNVAQDLEAAKRMMPAPGMRQSRDALCSLWYLLPQTQGAIEESLIGEYHRLGDIEKAVAAFATAANGHKAIARTAYEFVTATSGFNSVALPVEVLVSALGISYPEWTEACSEKKPLWGLLYDEEYPSAETYAYRTRNSVVTDVLLRALNKGTTGHTGEFRCLRDLIRGCRSSTAPYRTFLKDILVERRSLIENRFTYEQAMELYESAAWAFPKLYPLLEHHKCLVKKRLGGNIHEVYDSLRKLIASSHDRSILDQDSPSNLNTSAAAALSLLIKQGEIDPADGANAAFEHVSSALQHDQFSLHAHHVHAELLVKIATALRTRNRSAYMMNLERAARIVDRALLLVPPSGPRTTGQAKSMGMFKDLRAEIMMAVTDLDEARTAASALFKESGDQTGFAFVARMLLGKASDSGKGQHFKRVDDFIREVFKAIESAQALPSDEVTLCRVELVIKWHLVTDHGPVFWEQFSDDLRKLQENPRFADDVLCTFYAAVASFNLREFPGAEAGFQRLRTDRQRNEARRDIRCHFLGDKTDPKVFEGKIGAGASEKRFVYCAELGTDIPVRPGHLTQRSDETQHFKIGFSMLGPIAVDKA